MLIEPILGYKSTWRILSLLLETPRKLVSRKELFEFTHLGNEPLSRGLSRLVKAGFLIREKNGRKEFYYVNIANDYMVLAKELWEKERRRTRNLDYEIKLIVSEFVRIVLEFPDIRKVILFGSHAKGTASVRSDIDLAVIFADEKREETEITRIVKILEEKFNKEIQVHSLTEKSFVGKSKLVAEIRKEGIVLLG